MAISNGILTVWDREHLEKIRRLSECIPEDVDFLSFAERFSHGNVAKDESLACLYLRTGGM